MIKLSIIIPVFNAEKTLRRCLDSVLQQKDDELEIVVINDGSKDSSDKIIKEYKEKNPQTISYYKKQNTGVADTRNYGIKKAKGQYIMFLDSDDYIDTHLYSIVKQYMKKNIELIKFKLQRIDENGNILEKVDGPIFEITTGGEGFENLYASDVLLDSPCIYIIKKEIFIRNKLLFNVGTEHEDFGLIPFVIVLAKTMVSIDYYGYEYVQSNGSITRNNNYSKTKKKAYDALKQYDEALVKIEKHNINKKDSLLFKNILHKCDFIKNRNIREKRPKPIH